MRPDRLEGRSLQKGFVLLLIVLSLLAIAGVVIVTGILGSGSLARTIQRNSTASQKLQLARDALVGYAVGSFGGGSLTRPGSLPPPDTLQDNNYDGNQDIGCLDGSKANGLPALPNSVANMRCLGRLPWKTIGLQADAANEYDVLGTVPWYAVSANLADPDSCLQYLNSGTVATSPVSFACPSSAPPFPWLKVCDATGRLLSDKVAFVLIYPGEPITTQGRTQSRAGTPRPQPSDYLDAIPTPSGATDCTKYDNAGLSNEFVVGTQSVNFNDRILYVTIGEFMAEVEKRVAVQAREAILTFKGNSNFNAPGAYPWLAPLVDPDSPSAMVAQAGTKSGFMPFHILGTSFTTGFGWIVPGPYDLPSISAPTWNCSFLGLPTTCRLSSGSNTVTKTDMDAYASRQTNDETGSCTWGSGSSLDARLKYVNCSYSFPAIAPTVSLPYEILSGGTWYAAGNISGTRTRNVSILIVAMQGSTYTSAQATTATMLTRTVTSSSSMVKTGMVIIEDRFTGSASGGTLSNAQIGFGQTKGTGTVTVSGIRIYPEMPSWYNDQQWNKYVWAALAPGVSPATPGADCTVGVCFRAGTRTGLDAVVIATGKPISSLSQDRSMGRITDFMEAPNTTWSISNKFEAVNTPKTATYEDTVITIPR